ncbi:hypothetical protein VCHA35O137_30166 [Vibrio chagasii]|nr:hypothetical protein VCHA35P150_20451 [Vibrio chagasii]CAH6906884.1 hypothetical protein VCHA56P515_100060 [Vibrio chagasii]CAH6924329.1 hypothetical protein VCHA35O137_30166 [Vibrio chagasii]CAH6967555.1 hypothetical protein VCHA53O463_110102 [Vibrio chagasii]CAH7385151.1 hypothetical protein VCHA53O464_20017 [Vibrio chagasii]
MYVEVGIAVAVGVYFLYSRNEEDKKNKRLELDDMNRAIGESIERATLHLETQLQDANYEIMRLESDLDQCSDVLKHYVNAVGVIGFESTEETDKESVMTHGYSDKLNQEIFEEKINKFTNPQNSEYFKKRKSECSQNANFRNW